ncbi:glycerophosphodiester phosphodiesterase family protein [Hominifimenecus sp. rT4P-3]|uniref:glycerophosphodiester phosphodiesterase family protein n=1 Tax=Hominifimenecus sp. rT4P-3 TaxID=3242979 RepID=UPI003DA2CE35
MLSFSTPYFAHRGLHGAYREFPENSIAAFSKAIQHGFGIELDVRRSRDGALVVFHDSSLTRVCGKSGKIEELTLEEIQKYTLYDSDQKIPLFSEVLKLIHGQVPLLVEIKMEGIDPKLCEQVAQALDTYPGEFCIESFHPYALFWFRRNRPLIPRGQLVTNFFRECPSMPRWQKWLMRSLISNVWTDPHFFALDQRYRQTPFFRFLAKRKPTFGWTFRSKEEMRKAKGAFDFYIFEQSPPH